MYRHTETNECLLTVVVVGILIELIAANEDRFTNWPKMEKRCSASNVSIEKVKFGEIHWPAGAKANRLQVIRRIFFSPPYTVKTLQTFLLINC